MATRKRRTAAQKRATAKLVAYNRSRKRAAKRAPAKRRRRNPIAAPAARRRRTPVRAARRRRNPIARRRRRNPIARRGMINRIINNAVMPAVSATGGALLLDVAWAYLPIPATVKTGAFKHVAKALGAVVLSEMAGMVVSKKTAESMGVGALTVVMHSAGKEAMGRFFPTVKMDGIGYMSPAMITNDMGYYAGPGRLPAAAGNAATMGYYPPTVVSGSLETESNYRY